MSAAQFIANTEKVGNSSQSWVGTVFTISQIKFHVQDFIPPLIPPEWICGRCDLKPPNSRLVLPDPLSSTS